MGDRIVVPFTISCGEYLFCKRGLFSCRDVSSRDKEIAEKAYGYSPAVLFGFSHMFGGYAGGQAQFLRVPYADVGPIKVPEHLCIKVVLKPWETQTQGQVRGFASEHKSASAVPRA